MLLDLFLHMLFIEQNTFQGHLIVEGIVQIFIDNQNIISKCQNTAKFLT